MYKKGQIDKALGALPIFFLVLVIVALFVLLNAGSLFSKKSNDHVAVYSPVRMPVVFETISLEVDGKTTRMTVLEAFNLSRTDKELRSKMESEIIELAPSEGCLAFLWWDSELDFSIYGDKSLAPNGFFVVNKNGTMEKIEGISQIKEMYDLYTQRGYLETYPFTFAVDNSTYSLSTYNGVCLDG